MCSLALRAVTLVLALVGGVFSVHAEEGEKIRFRELETVIPAGWLPQPPSSSMRLAQYQVPGADAGADAAFVVYYFGTGQGGSAEANIARWKSQFSTADGGPVAPEVTTLEVDGLDITQAKLEGDYARGVGMGPQGQVLAGQTLLAAVVEYGDERIIFQLYGPSETVRGQEQRFTELLRGLRLTTQ